MANQEIPQDIIDSVFSANASGARAYLDKYGKYALCIEAALYKQVKDVGRLLITKVKVVRSEAIKTTEEPTIQNPAGRIVEEEPHPVGYRCSVIINWDGDGSKSANGNAKAQILGIFGIKDSSSKEIEELFKASFRDYVSDSQPACGVMVEASILPKGVAWNKEKKLYDHYIKLPEWRCLGTPGLGDNTHEAVQARRAEIQQYIGTELQREDAEREAAAANRAAGGQGASTGTFLPPAGSTPASGGGGAPPLPGAPSADPLAGWTFNPSNNASDPDPWYYRGNEQKRRSQIVAGAGK